MKERPILFSGPMVRAILEGRKSQTRRAMRRQPACIRDQYGLRAPAVKGSCYSVAVRFAGEEQIWPCPYGQPGDRLWVRETWAHDGPDLETVRARHEDAFGGGMTYGPYYLATEVAPDTLRWRPSIHMPRWASRITLEIIGIRVERLQDISDEDAWFEGCTIRLAAELGLSVDVSQEGFIYGGDAKRTFRVLWEKINGAGSWDANPWVWVVQFGVCK